MSLNDDTPCGLVFYHLLYIDHTRRFDSPFATMLGMLLCPKSYNPTLFDYPQMFSTATLSDSSYQIITRWISGRIAAIILFETAYNIASVAVLHHLATCHRWLNADIVQC